MKSVLQVLAGCNFGVEMKKPIVIKSDGKSILPLLIFAVLMGALIGWFSSSLIVNIVLVEIGIFGLVSCIPRLMGIHVLFGEKYFNVGKAFITENSINYKNIKAITEKLEDSRFGNRTILLIHLHDDKEITLDITLFKDLDKVRIKELLMEKSTATEQIQA